MAQDQDVFEGPVTEQKPQRPFILQRFDVDPNATGARKLTAEAFKEIAEVAQERMPEGTMRTALLERLDDTRAAFIRALPIEPKAPPTTEQKTEQ